MLFKIEILFLILITDNPIFASGRQNYTTSPPISIVRPHIPVIKTSKEIEAVLNSLPRKQISIHEIKASDKDFYFTGTFESEIQLQYFVEGINNYSESKRNIKIKIRKERFAGIDTHYYEITGENKW
ncbi:MAG: hypothetical protein COW00_14715 [Bdellovibrio sp. CG12_big_fil_rev_8_21_14_0_65_39_13]|nr:MAG: hypothetical protein COW78_14035 [Bdellovibrio sp. CG22_combo_CG10-13_8_21_14_all_39_27]PIQ58547.1 MAG: hypothetical protein COW00_14715 [Bdellovibrio sp. CG12_big_fil_rev_8_21_14_0_65_39_13]PIR32470.1 MAG: hypothetical protein COV37_19890 [Bdellovibrio sp. CG11_big_fil_rev_8_21_14_0_20_39_38]PJB53234.1 MAG: hypothetical protein CO099_08255 [Bdellovibrio sp. CG_4_9_14_3_um_filter_39_7]